MKIIEERSLNLSDKYQQERISTLMTTTINFGIQFKCLSYQVESAKISQFFRILQETHANENPTEHIQIEQI